VNQGVRTRKARPKSRDLVSGGDLYCAASGGVGDFGSMARRSVVKTHTSRREIL